MMESVVAKVVRIPSTDVFGLTAAYDAVIQSERDAMLYMTHPYLMAHEPDTDISDYLKAEMVFLHLLNGNKSTMLSEMP